MARSTSAINSAAKRKARQLHGLAAKRYRSTGELLPSVSAALARRAAAGGAAAGLGKSQSYETHAARPLVKAPSQQTTDERAARRWGQLLGLRRVSSKKRQRTCKTPIGNGYVGVAGHDGGAHYTGLQSCANVWTCPMCAPKIRAGRMTDVLTAFERHQANGGGFVFLTITVQHEREEALAFLLDLLQEAWTYTTRQRGYKEWRQRVGLVGNIAALEVTDGQNGWHPHKHIMLLTEGKLSKDTVKAWEAEVDALYGRYLDKHGRKRGAIGVGVRMDYVKDERDGVRKLGQYITKLQAGFELARGDLKQSRAGKQHGRVPFDRLDEAIAGNESSKARWIEYEKAMQGKSAIRMSKGLRDHLGMEQAKTDQQLAEEEVGEEAGVYVTAPLFRRIFWDGQAAAVLLVYRTGGDMAVLRWVRDRYGQDYSGDETAIPGRLLIG